MSFSDLISLENQLNDSLHSVKNQKVKTIEQFLFKKLKSICVSSLDLQSFVLIQTQLLLSQVERSRLQVRTRLTQTVIIDSLHNVKTSPYFFVYFGCNHQERRALEENQLLRKQVNICYTLTLAYSSLYHVYHIQI